ncbi:hypothetical protein AB0D30_30655 [Streptomyces sp. NPDC048409]|uniref:hypothetical protein n=1 Tax=Streptomyces sp. NPDC048409 TaxID=3154723 RepID=UPI0034495D48
MIDEASEGRVVPEAGPAPGARDRPYRSEVPGATVSFWIVNTLCTAVGGAAADLLDGTAGLGPGGASVLLSVLLAVALAVRFRARRPGAYWPAVALAGAVTSRTGAGLAGAGVPRATGTAVLAALLALVCAARYRRERTPSVRHVGTTGREFFSWAAVVAASALGTGTGDLLSAHLGSGRLLPAALLTTVVAAVAVAHLALDLDAAWSFWITYVLTRPLGNWAGDLLARPAGDRGAGAVVACALCLAVVLGAVVHRRVTRRCAR